MRRILSVSSAYIRNENNSHRSNVFLQAVLILTGLLALSLLIYLPLTEGRATNLDFIDIYSDKFILYGYVTSIPFFVALYNAFKLLRYIGQNKVFSSISINTLRNIKYCAIVLSSLIVVAGLTVSIELFTKKSPPSAVTKLLSIIERR